MSLQDRIALGIGHTPAVHQHHRIGNFEVLALDDVLSEEEGAELDRLIADMRYQRAEVDRSGTRQRSLVAEFDLATVFRAEFVRKVVAICRLVRDNEALQPYRVYLNNNSYGDMSYVHCDSRPGDATITAILYPNRLWDKDWGGETLFYDLVGQSIACVLPRFGRLVVFDGEIEHKGAVPTRECYEERLTFVVKLRGQKKL